MSRLAQYRQLEQQLAAQLAELEALKGSGELQREIEFENKLRDLLATYGFSLRDVINILDPQAGGGARRASAVRVRRSSIKIRTTVSSSRPRAGTTSF